MYFNILDTNYCPDGSSSGYHNGNCYMMFYSSKTWSEAEAHCNKLPRGHLASFHTDQEWELIRSLGYNSDRLHSLKKFHEDTSKIPLIKILRFQVYIPFVLQVTRS